MGGLSLRCKFPMSASGEVPNAGATICSMTVWLNATSCEASGEGLFPGAGCSASAAFCVISPKLNRSAGRKLEGRVQPRSHETNRRHRHSAAVDFLRRFRAERRAARPKRRPAGEAARGQAPRSRKTTGYECHGSIAQGVPQAGPRIGPPALGLPEFIKFVRDPIGDMAPVSAARASDADLGAIYAYLRTVHAPPKAGAGNAARGKAVVYAANCALCHGASRRRGCRKTRHEDRGHRAGASTNSQGRVRKPTGNMAPVSAARVSGRTARGRVCLPAGTSCTK